MANVNTNLHTPEADRDESHSPKRRRLSSGKASPSYGHPNELDDQTFPAAAHQPRRSSSRTELHPPKISIRSPINDSERDASLDRSADELDHNFFMRKKESSPGRAISTPRSDLQPESDDGYLASSPVPSAATPREYPPEVQYKQRLILRGHKRGVSAVKFSPDGKWIASCSADATLKVWDAQTGKHHHTLRGHLAGISTLAWSPDSKTLASGSDDKSIRLWDVNTGKAHVEPFIGHHNYVYCVVFSPKGNMLASGSHDEAVFLWDVRAARLMRSLPAHSDPVGGVDFVMDGTLIVSCSSDGLIRVWDTATGQCLRTFFHEDTPPVVSVRFSPNGKYILAWMLDSCLRMWNYIEGRCVKTYQGHKNEKYSLGGAFGTYGAMPTAFVASGSEDAGVLLWDVVSKEVLQRLDGHIGPVLGVDTHPTRKSIVSCGMDKTIRVWTDDTNSSDPIF